MFDVTPYSAKANHFLKNTFHVTKCSGSLGVYTLFQVIVTSYVFIPLKQKTM